jgi:hypothetical protein
MGHGVFALSVFMMINAIEENSYGHKGRMTSGNVQFSGFACVQVKNAP